MPCYLSSLVISSNEHQVYTKCQAEPKTIQEGFQPNFNTRTSTKTNHQNSIAREFRLAPSDWELTDYTTGKRSGQERTWKRKAALWKCVISFLHRLTSLVGFLQRRGLLFTELAQ
jgi:hypothetical protein